MKYCFLPFLTGSRPLFSLPRTGEEKGGEGGNQKDGILLPHHTPRTNSRPFNRLGITLGMGVDPPFKLG